MFAQALPPAATATATAPGADPNSIVTGCPNGQPQAYNRVGGAGYTAEQHARARAQLWSDRAGGSAMCLVMAAHEWAPAAPERARTLAATAFVRARWEAGRCAGAGAPGGGYRFTLDAVLGGMAMLDHPETPADLWRAAVRAAAQDPATFRYELDLAPVCEPAGVKPRTEWPAIEAQLRAELLSATTPTP